MNVVNNVVLVGRIVRQPELAQTNEGREFCNITLAIPRAFKSLATGEYETDFINVTVWETTARNVVEYCGKGSVIGVRGRLVHRSYEVPDFKAIRTTEVVGDRVSFIQTKNASGGAPQAEEYIPAEGLEINLPDEENAS